MKRKQPLSNTLVIIIILGMFVIGLMWAFSLFG